MKDNLIANLNDPDWGKGQSSENPKENPKQPRSDAPPELDQVFGDLANKLKGMFDKDSKRRGNFCRVPPGGPKKPTSKILSKFGFFVIIIGLLIAWLISGFYIVKEGQVGVVTQFGKYSRTVAPGFQWHIPTPIENVEIVDISRVRSFSVGYRDNARNKVLPEALMLTEDENIVDVQFDVQYRLKADMQGTNGKNSPAANYLFETRAPDESVRQAAETAMREIVGKQSMNKILYESRTQAAIDVRKLMQQILDRYKTGIEVITVAIQNVQPPEQVQAAFEDAIKAGQDYERQKNEGYAYASKVIPEARGRASRIQQEAEGYKAVVIQKATGEAERFKKIETEFTNSPEITRERMYLSSMEELLKNTPKILVDSKNNSPLLYLPIDKLSASTRTNFNRVSEGYIPEIEQKDNSTSVEDEANKIIDKQDIRSRALNRNRVR
ncbi:FtsH protease activity modulator HflK [Taylorella equigenitalis]|uniref:FtsH protease activity modulator HflK n=1 Tax=Taylorella equigenitalis TaxID=29575 RepID=UPI00237D2017|nr:FtsH protease activity modulator HflK [Taylorella equigenitalis]WDU45771.1 FtsH protease activity modulator HflK [Taylorella equigenitalis]